MGTTSLTFSLNKENRYEATFVSEGAVTVQMERAGTGYIYVYAHLDGLEKKHIGGYSSLNGSNNEILWSMCQKVCM